MHYANMNPDEIDLLYDRREIPPDIPDELARHLPHLYAQHRYAMFGGTISLRDNVCVGEMIHNLGPRLGGYILNGAAKIGPYLDGGNKPRSNAIGVWMLLPEEKLESESNNHRRTVIKRSRNRVK